MYGCYVTKCVHSIRILKKVLPLTISMELLYVSYVIDWLESFLFRKFERLVGKFRMNFHVHDFPKSSSYCKSQNKIGKVIYKSHSRCSNIIVSFLRL